MLMTSYVLNEVVFFLTISHNYLYNLTNYINGGKILCLKENEV